MKKNTELFGLIIKLPKLPLRQITLIHILMSLLPSLYSQAPVAEKWCIEPCFFDIDDAIRIDENHWLISNLSRDSFFPRKDCFKLVDVENCKVEWSIKRENDEFTEQNMVLDDVLINQKKYINSSKNMNIYVYDLKNGTLLWNAPEKLLHNNQLFYDTLSKSIVNVIHAENIGEFKVLFRDIHSGAVETTIIKTTITQKGPYYFTLRNGQLFILGNTLTCFSMKNREINWQTNLPFGFKKYSKFVFINSNICLSNGVQVAAFDLKKGTHLWETSISNGTVDYLQPLLDNNLIVTVCEKKDTAYQNILFILDSISGKIIWEHQLTGQLISMLYQDIDHDLYFLDGNTLVKLRGRTGKEVYRVPLPEEFGYYTQLPALFKEMDGYLIIGMETGVVKLNKDNGGILFSHFINNTERFLHSFVSEKAKYLDLSLSYDPGLDVYPLDFKEDTMKYVYASLGQYLSGLEYSRKKIISQMFKRGPESVDYIFDELGDYFVSQNLKVDMMHGYMSWGQIGLTAGSALVASFIINMANKANVLRMNYRQSVIDNLFQVFVSSFHGNYYIRPYFDELDKLAIIDLKNNTRADIQISPRETWVRNMEFRNPVFFHYNTHDDQILLCSATGNSAEKWYSRKRIIVTKNIIHGKRIKLAYRGIQRIDISTLQFKNVKDQPTFFTRETCNGQQKKLVEAILEKDVYNAVYLMAKGIKPDFYTKYGYTPYIFNSISNCGIAKYLLKNGAKPGHTDFEGWCAARWDWHGMFQPDYNKYVRKPCRKAEKY